MNYNYKYIVYMRLDAGREYLKSESVIFYTFTRNKELEDLCERKGNDVIRSLIEITNKINDIDLRCTFTYIEQLCVSYPEAELFIQTFVLNKD